jgi:hypothetical protein
VFLGALPLQHARKIRRVFDNYGFRALVVGCISPPPVPISPKKFFSAVALGLERRQRVLGRGWIIAKSSNSAA